MLHSNSRSLTMCERDYDIQKYSEEIEEINYYKLGYVLLNHCLFELWFV